MECRLLGTVEEDMTQFFVLSANKSATPTFNALAIFSREDSCGLPFNVRDNDSGLTFIIEANSFICIPLSAHNSLTLFANSLLIISYFLQRYKINFNNQFLKIKLTQNTMTQNKNNDTDYIDIHSEVLNRIDNDFWNEKICNLLKREIKNVDYETRQFLFNNPYNEFIIYDDCFVFGYRPTLKKLICLNDFIIIHDIDSTEVLSAIKLIFELYQEYGCINGTYKELIAQCS